MDFTYLTHTPAPPLDRYVELIWYARGQIDPPRELIAPTGSTVAAVVFGSPLRQTPAGGQPFLATTGFLIGPHDRPIVNEPTAETHRLGILTPPAPPRPHPPPRRAPPPPPRPPPGGRPPRPRPHPPRAGGAPSR